MELLSNNIILSAKVQLTFLVGILSFMAFFLGCIFPKIAKFCLSIFVSPEVGEKGEKLLQPYRNLIGITFGL
jgi:MscS family membrane protein